MTAQNAEHPSEGKDQSNAERMIGHLEDGSLSKCLLQAHNELGTKDAIKAVIDERLKEVRKNLVGKT